ncbi:MAG: DUF5309 domain-containing protein [Oscillospiraceae bacterium]|nr:DUF5309 domain-containing protein [Oscillospiraceae bacterium]
MANQVTGLGTGWALPNYAGELFSADATQTPLLSMTGGLTGGRQTDNFEFPTAVLYDYPTADQPEISEQASATAPQATHALREQETNVVQIHQEVIDLSYVALSNLHRMSGLNTAGQEPAYGDERLFQLQHKLIKVARDVEHSFINGSYQKASNASEANRTRGLLELTRDNVNLSAGGAPLSADLLRQLYREMADAGAYFNNMVMFLSAYQKQMLTEVYASQMGLRMPECRTVGGVNITQVETDFFNMGIVWNRFVPADTILIADVAHIAPVFQVVPGKGVLFTEELAKTGASEKVQLFGQIGLAHGAGFLHGSITGLQSL